MICSTRNKIKDKSEQLFQTNQTKVNNIRYRNVKFRETVKRVRAINVQKAVSLPSIVQLLRIEMGKRFLSLMIHNLG